MATTETEKPPKVKKVPKKKAFENAKKLREVMRGIYRACHLDPQYSGVSSPLERAKQLAAARGVVDAHVNGLDAFNRERLTQALEKERITAAEVPAGHLHVMVQQAYELVQQLPSWDGLPEGEANNKLRAIEALVKNGNAPLDTIRMIIDPQKYTDTLPEPPKPPKPPAKATPWVESIPAPIPHPETGLPVSKYNLKAVNKSGVGDWGYQSPYYLIKKGTPMTWGTCDIWIDKGNVKPGAHGSIYYVHPEYATNKQVEYHFSKTAPLHATDPPEGSDDGTSNETEEGHPPF